MVATPSATFEARDLVDVHMHGDDGPIIITAPQAGTNPRRRLTADSLLTCDFDNSTCGFDYTTDYNWTRRSGGTPTWLTGPTGDHTSGSGYYMYVEAGEYREPSESATSRATSNRPEESSALRSPAGDLHLLHL